MCLRHRLQCARAAIFHLNVRAAAADYTIAALAAGNQVSKPPLRRNSRDAGAVSNCTN
jgi:hypothetical protein